jgi:hypothetical protein
MQNINNKESNWIELFEKQNKLQFHHGHYWYLCACKANRILSTFGVSSELGTPASAANDMQIFRHMLHISISVCLS